MRVKLGFYGEVVSGSFGVLDSKRVSWMTCRDSFHALVGKDKSFYIYHEPARLEQVIAAMNVIEGRLQIERTRFVRTDNDHAIMITPSRFWRKQPIRFSLFTIFLRAAWDHYDGQDLIGCFKKNRYIRETLLAVLYFLDGYTWITGKVASTAGWYDWFGGFGGFTLNCMTEESCKCVPGCVHRLTNVMKKDVGWFRRIFFKS